MYDQQIFEESNDDNLIDLLITNENNYIYIIYIKLLETLGV